MVRSRRRALQGLIGAALASTVVTGCSSDKRDANSPESDLEPWDGQLRELFNDEIHPGAVGLSMDSQAPARDPLLRLRTTNSDVAARLKVVTVDHYSVGAKTSFVLKLQLIPPPFFEPKLDDSEFEVVIKKHMSSFGIVQNLGDKLREMMFIGFMRKFPGEEGPVVHWHLTEDSEAVAEVVKEAAILDEIGGSER